MAPLSQETSAGGSSSNGVNTADIVPDLSPLPLPLPLRITTQSQQSAAEKRSREIIQPSKKKG